MVFSGRSNPELAAKIAEKLDITLGGVQLKTCANGEIFSRNISSNIAQMEQVFSLDGRDRFLGVLPFFHSFGFTGTPLHLMFRGREGKKKE